jgi:hypothetical protein
MKTNYIRIPFFCLIFTASLGFAVDIESLESYKITEHLLTLKEPAPPAFIEDMVVFTASSSLRRVGIAFADEGFYKVHWFRQMVVSQDPLDIALDPKNTKPYKDSGILFYVHKAPEGASEIEYRLIINGLWTTDPANPSTRRDSHSGLTWSTLALPPRTPELHPLKGPPGSLSFVFQGPPGETVSVGGSFNGWDPFMYELKEGPAGTYTINIPLPPGRYQYVFFHRGRRYLDPNNTSRVYSKDGRAASEIIIQ